MRMEKLNKALDHIDCDLIDEFVRENEALQKRKAARAVLLKAIPIAACFVILVSVGSAYLGYNYAKLNGGTNQNAGESNQLQIVFEKEGRFVFEYKGKLYQAYVSPALEEDNLDFAFGESVSIQNVGEHLSNVEVTDEKGNVASFEIYSSKNISGENAILLKLDYGYFPASNIE